MNPPGGHGGGQGGPQHLNSPGGAGPGGVGQQTLGGNATHPATPTPAGATADISTSSSPGAVPLPPVPPPTPQGGVNGVPVPPPPPPTLPGTSSQSHLKRVNWEKVPGAEGTIWREVCQPGSLVPIFASVFFFIPISHSPFRYS